MERVESDGVLAGVIVAAIYTIYKFNYHGWSQFRIFPLCLKISTMFLKSLSGYDLIHDDGGVK